MTRRAILLTIRREYSTRARVLFALLALIQFIAPTWHVCAMGGNSCCPPKTAGESTLQHCKPRYSPENAKPNCDACPKPRTPQTLTATPEPHEENCLAKLLLGMPWQCIALPAQAEYSFERRVIAARQYSFQSVFFSALPPGRAPPAFF